MHRLRQFSLRLWANERGISSVEYVMLLAMISGGVIVSLELLGGAVSNQLSETALWFGDDGIVGDNCGNEGGAGQGSGNTC